MKICYKDGYGTYTITEKRDGTAHLKCVHYAYWGGKVVGLDKDYKSVQGAKIALGRYCGGMPQLINRG